MKRVLSVGLWVVLVVFMLTACATSKEKITKIEDLKCCQSL